MFRHLVTQNICIFNFLIVTQTDFFFIYVHFRNKKAITIAAIATNSLRTIICIFLHHVHLPSIVQFGQLMFYRLNITEKMCHCRRQTPVKLVYWEWISLNYSEFSHSQSQSTCARIYAHLQLKSPWEPYNNVEFGHYHLENFERYSISNMFALFLNAYFAHFDERKNWSHQKFPEGIIWFSSFYRWTCA